MRRLYFRVSWGAPVRLVPGSLIQDLCRAEGLRVGDIFELGLTRLGGAKSVGRGDEKGGLNYCVVHYCVVYWP